MYTTTSVDISIRSLLLNPLRISEYILCITCLVTHIYCLSHSQVKMLEVLKNLLYITSCAFIIIITHDFVLICLKKPIDQNTWLAFSITATILFATCTAFVTFWELASYVKWIYFAVTLVNTIVFGLDSCSILWHLRTKLKSQHTIIPSRESSGRQSIVPTKKEELIPEPSELHYHSTPRELQPPPQSFLLHHSPTFPTTDNSTQNSVAIQCDSLDHIDLDRLIASVPSCSSRYQPLQGFPQTPHGASYYNPKRKRCPGCHTCHSPPTLGTPGGGATTQLSTQSSVNRPATTSTYGGTFHVSKDVAPLSSPIRGTTRSSIQKMKSPWTNESLYVWEGKQTGGNKAKCDAEHLHQLDEMKRY